MIKAQTKIVSFIKIRIVVMNATKAEEKKKIDFESALEFIKLGMTDIRELNANNEIKAQKEKRLGTSALIKLAGRSSRTEAHTASLSYYNREVTRLRTAVKRLGFLRHDFNEKVELLKSSYPLINKELSNLSNIKLNDAKELIEKSISSIKSRESRTKDSDKKSELKKSIVALQKLKYEPVILSTLVRTSEQKKSLDKTKEDRVNKYHTQQRPINYKKTYEKLAEHIASQHNWESLAFALCLASGRRCTEVLCSIDGKFEKTKNKLEAKFTTIVKTKEAKTFNIPLLVEFDIFINALERLRNHPRVKGIMDKVIDMTNYDERHRLINSSVTEQLNIFVKQTMNSKKVTREAIKVARKKDPNLHPEMLKDTRAMYARITYAEYSANAKKAGRLPNAEDEFFTNKLGHDDKSSQAVYKQFQIINADILNQREVKKTKADAATASLEVKNRLSELEELFKEEKFTERAAFIKYSEFVIKGVKTNPAQKITSTWIKSELGGNKGIIGEFAKLIKEAGLQKPF